LNSKIRIVKRKLTGDSTDHEPPVETKPLNQSTRDMTIVVKSWIAELKERKRNQRQSFAQLQ